MPTSCGSSAGERVGSAEGHGCCPALVGMQARAPLGMYCYGSKAGRAAHQAYAAMPAFMRPPLGICCGLWCVCLLSLLPFGSCEEARFAQWRWLRGADTTTSFCFHAFCSAFGPAAGKPSVGVCS
jgi:hypothetical protein